MNTDETCVFFSFRRSLQFTSVLGSLMLLACTEQPDVDFTCEGVLVDEDTGCVVSVLVEPVFMDASRTLIVRDASGREVTRPLYGCVERGWCRSNLYRLDGSHVMVLDMNGVGHAVNTRTLDIREHGWFWDEPYQGDYLGCFDTSLARCDREDLVLDCPFAPASAEPERDIRRYKDPAN